MTVPRASRVVPAAIDIFFANVKVNMVNLIISGKVVSKKRASYLSTKSFSSFCFVKNRLAVKPVRTRTAKVRILVRNLIAFKNKD